MSACGKAGRWEHTLALLSKLPDQKIEIDSYACSTAVWACSRETGPAGWQKALAVFFDLCVLGVRPNEVALGSAIAACEVAGCWETALQLLWSEGAGLVLDTACMNCAISALQTGSQWQLAFCLFESLLPSVRPNDLTYSALMRACRRAYHWERALHVWAACERVLNPSLLTWSEAVSAAECGGKWEFALLLASSCADSSLKLDSILCTAAASACHKSSRWREPLHLLHLMRIHGLRASLLACNAATASCGSSPSRWKRVFQLLAWTDRFLKRDAAIQAEVVSIFESTKQGRCLGPLLQETAELTLSALGRDHRRHGMGRNGTWRFRPVPDGEGHGKKEIGAFS
ncbi:unnamed protein product [Symbiodinium pilosum]|uniref:Pentatricopeptide repeat-containing protein, chloroplastic n=1 Tax=Symbiodinium pilosum TaxID=2952 RepID=A0A812Y5U3_SYMPI|nr:unnamed protein product [Symbiodinium pilosum]